MLFIERMKKIILLSVAVAASFSLLSAQDKGGITPQMLQQIQKKTELTPSQKALRNALAGTSIKKLAINSENRFKYDRDFKYQVRLVGITDQQSSGRCWLFTGQNVLRAKIIEQYKLSGFKFSAVYPFFFDQLEKANLFLQAMIDNVDKADDDRLVQWLFRHPLQDGGQYTGISDILTKYGAVPEEVMPETYSSSHTGEMARLLSMSLREGGLAIRQAHADKKSQADLEKIKETYLTDVYRILKMCLGTPPQSFSYTLKDKDGQQISTKTYTPQSFLKEMLPGEDLKTDFVMLMNDPTRPYYKTYEIAYDRHSYDGQNWTYINVPMEEIKQMAMASIKGNEMMYFSCDVGKELNSSDGTLDLNNYNYEDIFDVKFKMDKAQRIHSFASASSHAMTLIGVDVDEQENPTKWLIENSWGAKSGYEGKLVMTDRWFEEYMFRLVVNKKYLSPKVKALLGQKPILLPPWDPMF